MTDRVPDDFPWETTPASLSGSQPKLAGRKIGSKFIVGPTAEERHERWDVCEDLSHQLVAVALKDAMKYPENSHEVTLRRVRRGVEGKGWVSTIEADWLMARLCVLLGW